jgi:hypothetical protein
MDALRSNKNRKCLQGAGSQGPTFPTRDTGELGDHQAKTSLPSNEILQGALGHFAGPDPHGQAGPPPAVSAASCQPPELSLLLGL